MSNWNEQYTRRKQKEMMGKVLADEKKQQPLKPLYQNLYGTSSYTRKQQQAKHDRFCWTVGFVIMAILTGFFVWLMIEIL